MKKHSLPITLILMMLITPIASAFDHCAGMDMSMHLSKDHVFSISQPTANPTALTHKSLNGSENTQADMDCQGSDRCTFHMCGAAGIITSSLIINSTPSFSYSTFEYTSTYSTALSPKLKPPRQIL